jgi:hypothetical protein
MHTSFIASISSIRPKYWVYWTAGILLCSVGLVLIIQNFDRPPILGGDFLQDYRASQLLLQGASIYSETRTENNHPPLTAIIFLPLALFPFEQSYMAWKLISIILYFAVIVMIQRGLKIKLDPAWYVLLVGYLLCWYPFHVHLELGQFSLLLTTLIFGGWLLLRRNHQLPAGVLFGIAALIKMFPLFLLVYLVFRKKWTALVGMISSIAIGTLGMIAVVGKDDFFYFLFSRANENAQNYNTYPVNHSVYGFFSRLFLGGPWFSPITYEPGFTWLFTISTYLLIVFLLIRYLLKIPATQIGDDTTLSLTIIAMLLVSPITWQHIFPILLLPSGLLFSAIKQDNLSIYRIFGLISLILFSIPDVPLVTFLIEFFAPRLIPWFISPILLIPILGMMILWISMVRVGKKSKYSDRN